MIAAVEARGVIIDLLIVALVALFVYGGCHFAGRPDLGRVGAAVVIVIGGLLVLLGAV